MRKVQLKLFSTMASFKKKEKTLTLVKLARRGVKFPKNCIFWFANPFSHNRGSSCIDKK
ncbi:hypothetical protein [Methanobrevibacter sp.]